MTHYPLSDVANGFQPFLGNTQRKKIAGLVVGEEGGLSFFLNLGNDLFNAFFDLDDLGGAGLWVNGKASPLGPGIGVIVTIDIAEGEEVITLMKDNSEIVIDANGPEVFVFRFINAMKLTSRGVGGDLKVKDCFFDLILGVFVELFQAAGKGARDDELHKSPFKSEVWNNRFY